MIIATGEVLEDLEDALLTLEGDGIARQRSNGFTEAYGSIPIDVTQQQPSFKRRKVFEDKFGRKREAWRSRHEPSSSSLSPSASQSSTPEAQGPPAPDEYAR